MTPEWWSALLTLLAASGCAVAAVVPSEIPAGSTPVPMERLIAEQESGIERPVRAVIRTAAEWETSEKERRRVRVPSAPSPAVDWGRFMVILAAMGVQTTGGHTIAIDGVYRSGGRLWVRVREVSPGPDCVTTQSLTTPADAVRVPQSDEPVSFIEHRETRACG